MLVYQLLVLLLDIFFNFLHILLVRVLCLLSKLLEPLFLKQERSSIMLEVSLTVPIIAYDLSSIIESPIHGKYTGFCIFLFLKFYLNHSIRMGFINSKSFYFSYLRQFFVDLFFY